MKGKRFLLGAIVVGIIIAIILILVFRRQSFEVSFVSDGVSILESQKVKENGTINEPDVPSKEGYKFVGWYSNSEKFDFSTKITEDITLEARWVKEEEKTYTITFDANGGTKVSNIEVEEVVSSLPTPKKEGYTFVGWFNGDEKVTTETKITTDLTLVAKWEKVEMTTIKTTKKITNKKTTVKTTTTTTTTAKVEDVITYQMVDLKDDTTGKVTLYILKNGNKVSGSCDITTNSGTTVTKEIPASGYITNKNIINKITNIKAN